VNVVKCLGYATEPLALIMELIDGVDLSRLLHSDTVYTWSYVRDFARDMGCALSYVHQQGLLHRDVKASNFIVCLKFRYRDLRNLYLAWQRWNCTIV